MCSKRAYLGLFMTPFLRKMQKVKSVFGLHIRGRIAYEPIPKSTQCTHKIEEKSGVCQIHTLFIKNMKKYENYHHRVPKWVREFWWWRPLGQRWRSSLLFDTKSASKVIPRCLN